MSHYAKEVGKIIGTAVSGSCPPQSVAASATGGPGNSNWVLGSSLIAKGRGLAFFAQTGAFTSTPSCAFKLQAGTDASGASGADVSGVDTVTIATANTVAAGVDVPLSVIDPAKYYGVVCAVTGGTSALVAAQLRVMDPIWND